MWHLELISVDGQIVDVAPTRAELQRMHSIASAVVQHLMVLVELAHTNEHVAPVWRHSSNVRLHARHFCPANVTELLRLDYCVDDKNVKKESK